MTQYKLTPSGQRALEAGDELLRFANRIAEDGKISPKELEEYGFTKMEADHFISVLTRYGVITPIESEEEKMEHKVQRYKKMYEY